MICKRLSGLVGTILILGVPILSSQAQELGTARAIPDRAAKKIPWDEPGKPAGVTAIDAGEGKGTRRRGARADRSASAPPRRPAEHPAPETRNPASSPSKSASSTRAPEATQVTPPLEARHKEEELRLRAKAEADVGRVAAYARAKALEEEKRTDLERSRDRFVGPAPATTVRAPEATGSIAPPRAKAGEVSWTRGLCRRMFFGLVGC